MPRPKDCILMVHSTQSQTVLQPEQISSSSAVSLCGLLVASTAAWRARWTVAASRFDEVILSLCGSDDPMQ
eukprot:scaffold16920_cov211-Skeletonema_menzelii.AAC.1